MDTSDPSIFFDENGISNHYWDFHNKIKPHWHRGSQGDKALLSMVETIKRDGYKNEFDCIIGLSGGADSSYMLHKMVKDYQLKPLVFHVDGGWNSEIAVNNIQRLVDKLKIDLYTEVINWEEMRDFQLAMFKSGVPHLDIPQDMAFIGVLYKFASRHGIKHILNGGNISTECVLMPKEFLYWGTDMIQVRDILKKHGSGKMKTYPFTSVFYHKIFLRYFKGIKVNKPLNNLEYIKEKAMAELENQYGWKPYPQKHFESRFTKFFEGYWLPSRFGYDMRRNQFSSLILTGQMKRDEALNKLEKLPINEDEISNEMEYICSKLNISQADLKFFHDMPKKYFWDYRNQHRVFEIGERVLNYFTGTRRGGAL